MSKLSHTSQIVSDLFYQSYRSDESFFEDAHFRYIIATVYDTLLVNDFQKSKQESFSEGGYIFPTFAHDLIKPTPVLPVHTDGDFKYIDTGSVVSFPYDNWGYGVQKIRCKVNGKCPTFKRVSPSMRDKFNIIPFTELVYFWIEGQRTYLYGAGNIPTELVAEVIMSVDVNDDDFYIPQSYESQIINAALQLFKQASQGGVVDMSNDSNPNAVLQQEINNVFRNLKTKAQ